MTYRVYRFRQGWEELAIKHNIFEALKVISRDLDPEFDIHYVVIENDGKSDFPIITMNTLEQYYEEVEKYLGKDKKLTKKRNYGIINSRDT